MRLAQAIEFAHPKDSKIDGTRVKVHGLPITVEHRKGSIRKLHNDDGKEVYKMLMHSHYGFLNGTKGRDGDEVDCFLGPISNADEVYVVHMLDKGPDKNEREDEDKCMIGYPSADAAKTAFLQHYPKDFYGGMTALPIKEFKLRLATSQLPHRKKKLTANRCDGTYLHSIGACGCKDVKSAMQPSVGGPAEQSVLKLRKQNNDDASGAGSVPLKENQLVKVKAGFAGPMPNVQVAPVYQKSLSSKSTKKGAMSNWSKNVKKATCPNCKSKSFKLMPTDFETAKCNKCGKTFDTQKG